MRNSIIDPTLTQTVGLDVGDRHSSFCLIDSGGEILEESRIATSAEALTGLFARLEPSRVVLEACGHVHWIAKLAGEHGHEVIPANPRELHLISQGGRKSDRNDARTLARLGRVAPDLLRPIKLRSEGCRASRSLLSARDELVETRTRLVTFVRGQVKSFGGRIPGCSAGCFHRRAGAHVPEILCEVVTPILDVLAQLETRIRAYDRQIERVAEERHPETKVLRQVDGVGPILSLAFAATIEDPNRFSSSRTVGSYVGLAPRLYESGTKSPQLSISKCGDRYLRRLLVNAAAYILGPLARESDLRRYGERIAGSGSQRDKARARIAVARKLACLLHHLWRTGSVWDRNYQLAR